MVYEGEIDFSSIKWDFFLRLLYYCIKREKSQDGVSDIVKRDDDKAEAKLFLAFIFMMKNLQQKIRGKVERNYDFISNFSPEIDINQTWNFTIYNGI